MTPRKKWPHQAEWTRMDCIALARTGRQALLAVLDCTQDPRTLRAIAKATECLRDIEAKLVDVKGENHA